MLTIIKRHRTAPGQEEGPLQRVKIGKLFMVDLAGSERLKKSLSTGDLMRTAEPQLEESQAIDAPHDILTHLSRATWLKRYK